MKEWHTEQSTEQGRYFWWHLDAFYLLHKQGFWGQQTQSYTLRISAKPGKITPWCLFPTLHMSFSLKAPSLRRRAAIPGYIIPLIPQFLFLLPIFLRSLSKVANSTHLFLEWLIHFGVSNLSLTSRISAPADCCGTCLHIRVIAPAQEKAKMEHHWMNFGDLVLKYTMVIFNLLTVGTC